MEKLCLVGSSTYGRKEGSQCLTILYLAFRYHEVERFKCDVRESIITVLHCIWRLVLSDSLDDRLSSLLWSSLLLCSALLLAYDPIRTYWLWILNNCKCFLHETLMHNILIWFYSTLPYRTPRYSAQRLLTANHAAIMKQYSFRYRIRGLRHGIQLPLLPHAAVSCHVITPSDTYTLPEQGKGREGRGMLFCKCGMVRWINEWIWLFYHTHTPFCTWLTIIIHLLCCMRVCVSIFLLTRSLLLIVLLLDWAGRAECEEYCS